MKLLAEAHESSVHVPGELHSHHANSAAYNLLLLPAALLLFIWSMAANEFELYK